MAGRSLPEAIVMMIPEVGAPRRHVFKGPRVIRINVGEEMTAMTDEQEAMTPKERAPERPTLLQLIDTAEISPSGRYQRVPQGALYAGLYHHP